MSGTKHDAGKEPLDLIPYESMQEIAKVLAFGAKKYAPFNWTKGIAYSRLLAAAMRHMHAYNSGIDKDEETGISHLGHAGCCIMFLLWMEKNRPDLDDRGFKLAKNSLPKAPGENPERSDL